MNQNVLLDAYKKGIIPARTILEQFSALKLSPGHAFQFEDKSVIGEVLDRVVACVFSKIVDGHRAIGDGYEQRIFLGFGKDIFAAAFGSALGSVGLVINTISICFFLQASEVTSDDAHDDLKAIKTKNIVTRTRPG